MTSLVFEVIIEIIEIFKVEGIRMTNHDIATFTQSNAHPKLFIGTGNVFAPEKFNADGIAAFVKEGFSGTNVDYDDYKRNPSKNVKIYEYIYCVSKPLPYGKEITTIVDNAISTLVSQGCKNIIMPPIRTEDCSNEENEKLIVVACKNWLEKNEVAPVEKITIVDLVGQMEKRGY